LKHELGLKPRQIARSCGISPTTLYDYLSRLEERGITWPLPKGWDDRRLELAVFGAEDPLGGVSRPLPSMSYIHRELRRKKVTRRLLWEEYRAEYPDGYSYTQFCEYYDRWRKNLAPSLRQEHVAGQKVFVDWAGQTVAVGDGKAYLFVAVLGASNYTYVEAFEHTKQSSWIEAHVHAYEFFQGVPVVTVPDNAKTAINKACRYDPEENPTYREMAQHYGTAIIPARPRKPKDKPKVENAVLHAERRILAALRDRTFFSVAELNRAIRPLLHRLNEEPLQKLEGSRLSLFNELEKPALLPLPEKPYELTEWRKAQVNIDYHVQIDWHFYSVPYRLIQQPVEARLTSRTVEILHQGRRVALHRRSYERGKATTLEEHRPKSHQRHLQWSPSRLILWAQNDIGPHCATAVRTILEAKRHPEQGYRSCLGLMRLARGYGKERLEAACRRALRVEACTYQSIKSMLKAGLDREDPPEEQAAPPTPRHANIRGRAYYHNDESAENKDVA